MRQTYTTSLLAALVGLVMLDPAVSGCVDRPQWDCRRSSECSDGEFCRAGGCVPALGFIPDGGAPTTDGGDAAPQRCVEGVAPGPGELVLNEVLVNPPTGSTGDANGDGVRDAYDDEFVEVVNATDAVLDLTGVSIRNGADEKFAFGPTCLNGRQAAVVFGGGEPAERADMLVRVAPSRFGFSNGGGSVALVGADGRVLGSLSYENAPSEALTLSPQLDGADYVPHSALVPERLLSPGTCADGEPFERGCHRPAGD